MTHDDADADAERGAELVMESPMIATFLDEAVALMNKNGAQNCMEFIVRRKDDPTQNYVFTIQRIGGKTTLQLRDEALAENARLRAELAALKEPQP